MKNKITIAVVFFLLLNILTGFNFKNGIEVSIVSTSLNKNNQTLKYNIKFTINNCNKLCKKNLNLQVKPGIDLKNLMITDDKNKLFLVNKSKYFYGDVGKAYLEYKIKDNVKENEVMYFSKYATLLVKDDTKVIQKISLKKYRNHSINP